MRILFVIPYFVDAWAYGGQPRSAWEMARALVKRGHAVDVVTTDSGGPHRLDLPSSTIVREGVTVHYCRNFSNTLAYRRLFLPWGLRSLLDRLVPLADVVHIHELRSVLSVAAAAAARRHGVPCVVSPHGGLPHLGRRGAKVAFDYLWGRRILAGAVRLIAVSPLESAQARAWGYPEERITVVPNGVALTGPGAGAVARSSKTVLFLGRLHPIKGADLLIEAFARLSISDARLVLAGPDDGAARALRRLVRKLGLASRVHFAGNLNPGQKEEALAGCALVIVPSRHEAFALTVVEALLCGRPVVMSSACGLFPTPGPDEGVLTFASESVEDLAAKMERALRDSLLRSAALRGREFAAREFSTERVAQRTEAAYSVAGTQDRIRTESEGCC